MPTDRQLTPADPDYPAPLRTFDAPPDPLWIRGALPSGLGVAVVGTREASQEALAFTRELVAALVAANVTVWSGGARGIDAAAHAAALDAGGKTVVVTATGLDHVFPEGHADLFARTVEAGGALVSPFPRDTTAARPTFFHRNGVLAALTAALVVVEAPAQSGARNAAATARRLGRPVWAVPSSPWDADRVGGRLELDLGARALTAPRVFLASLGLEPKTPPRGRTRVLADARGTLPLPALSTPSLPEDLDAVARALAGACARGAVHVDDLCAFSGLPAAVVLPSLLTLTLRAVLVEGPAGWYRLVST